MVTADRRPMGAKGRFNGVQQLHTRFAVGIDESRPPDLTAAS
jgi:hypothetical protein